MEQWILSTSVKQTGRQNRLCFERHLNKKGEISTYLEFQLSIMLLWLPEKKGYI